MVIPHPIIMSVPLTERQVSLFIDEFDKTSAAILFDLLTVFADQDGEIVIQCVLEVANAVETG